MRAHAARFALEAILTGLFVASVRRRARATPTGARRRSRSGAGPAQATDAERVRPSCTQWQSPGGAEVLQWLFLKVLVPAPSHSRSSVLPKA
jgi:hypothetical protein